MLEARIAQILPVEAWWLELADAAAGGKFEVIVSRALDAGGSLYLRSFSLGKR